MDSFPAEELKDILYSGMDSPGTDSLIDSLKVSRIDYRIDSLTSSLIDSLMMLPEDPPIDSLIDSLIADS